MRSAFTLLALLGTFVAVAPSSWVGQGPIQRLVATYATIWWIVQILRPKPARRHAPLLVDLPFRKTNDPIRASKYAYLIMDESGRVCFLPLFTPVKYGPEGQARCYRQGLMGVIKGSHRAPDPRCSCGFYALPAGHGVGWRQQLNIWRSVLRMRLRRKPITRDPIVRLDVELMGRVVVYSKGYRAESQRVLSVVVPRRCSLCWRKAVGLGGTNFFPATSKLTPTCGCQIPPRWSPAEVANMLGTEVRWGRKSLLTKWFV